jgi:hypothetical protein
VLQYQKDHPGAHEQQIKEVDRVSQVVERNGDIALVLKALGGSTDIVSTIAGHPEVGFITNFGVEQGTLILLDQTRKAVAALERLVAKCDLKSTPSPSPLSDTPINVTASFTSSALASQGYGAYATTVGAKMTWTPSIPGSTQYFAVDLKSSSFTQEVEAGNGCTGSGRDSGSLDFQPNSRGASPIFVNATGKAGTSLLLLWSTNPDGSLKVSLSVQVQILESCPLLDIPPQLVPGITSFSGCTVAGSWDIGWSGECPSVINPNGIWHVRFDRT